MNRASKVIDSFNCQIEPSEEARIQQYQSLRRVHRNHPDTVSKLDEVLSNFSDKDRHAAALRAALARAQNAAQQAFDDVYCNSGAALQNCTVTLRVDIGRIQIDNVSDPDLNEE